MRHISAFITPNGNDLYIVSTSGGTTTTTARMVFQQNNRALVQNMGVFFPNPDNAVILGNNGFRWSAVWAANGTIQTSDAREKTEVADAVLGTDFVKALRPVSYKWIEGGQKPTGTVDENGNFIDENGNDIDPLSLIGKHGFATAALKIESIFIGSKISLQVKSI
jgi:hypothetical protein